MPEIVWDATLYDKQHHFVSDYGADVLQWLAPKADEHILDVGCGTGQLAAQIAASGALVLGTDASADMVANAKAAYPNLSFEVVDGASLPYQENFDAVFSNATFHWIENQQALTDGLFKSLKPGGRLVAEFGGKGNVKSITDAIAAAASQLGFTDQVVTDFWYFPSVSTYASLLESKGFEVEQVWLFDRPTKLIGEAGMYIWINQFAQHAFKNLDEAQAEAIKNLAVEILKPDYFINGEWIADYRRIRVKALKR
ncbi:methyltransferase domain-containing protein [Pedobacter sp. HDW13]|uniref:class I SAM-dependent methyltransferase n=1 Tax=unclassified Pedobacter TaxID=2628915 RepID=UPI000F5B4C95|nr:MULTISPECIES: class I SAM-dependent methyltransferase [unclassified Pedobacter]QIL38647.1 methyltransferase domain-containing protein [Pedobacter sp. HDW13]RQO80196.1 SAM-dependent methyltransferase [Pedobacter sp. KBW01]